MVGYLLLFGNEMLLTSFFASSLITVTVSIILYKVISSPELCGISKGQASHSVCPHFQRSISLMSVGQFRSNFI